MAEKNYDEVLRKGIISVRDWKPFARTMLKISRDDIQVIEDDHKGDFAEQRIKMVEKWEKRLDADYTSNRSNEEPSPELLERKMHEFHGGSAARQPTLSSPQEFVDLRGNHARSREGLTHAAVAAEADNEETNRLEDLGGRTEAGRF